MAKRAVLYARVSGDDRATEGRNLASQLEMGREYARSHGYAVVAELVEDERGASGADPNLPQLGRALEMARGREYDVLVTRELDRLARSLGKQLRVEEDLKRCGVSAEYVLAKYEDTPEGQLAKNVRAVIADYERDKISERMVRGRRNKVKAGSVHVQGRPPFGYAETRQDGRYRLVVCEPEAEVVRLVFGWYTKGNGDGKHLGVTQIAHKLTAMAVPTFADRRPGQGVTRIRPAGTWARATVMRLLSNETYAGVWHFGKKGEQLAVDVPPIVTRETWDTAQAERVRNRINAKRNVKQDYLLARRVTCGACGHKMCGMRVAYASGSHHAYYGCPANWHKRDYVSPCSTPSFRADIVDGLVWEWVAGWLRDPEQLESGLRKHLAKQDAGNAPARERLRAVASLMQSQDRQMERLVDLYVTGELTREQFSERKAKIEATRRGLAGEQASLEAQLDAQSVTSQQILDLKGFAERVGRGLEGAERSFAVRRQIIEELDLRATLVVEDGQKVVYARCKFGDKKLCVSLQSTHVRGRKQKNGLRLAARIVLPSRVGREPG